MASEFSLLENCMRAERCDARQEAVRRTVKPAYSIGDNPWCASLAKLTERGVDAIITGFVCSPRSVFRWGNGIAKRILTRSGAPRTRLIGNGNSSSTRRVVSPSCAYRYHCFSLLFLPALGVFPADP